MSLFQKIRTFLKKEDRSQKEDLHRDSNLSRLVETFDDKIIISFDVDDTLNISNGPIPVNRVKELKDAGFIVGFIGNASKALDEGLKGFDFYEGGDKAQMMEEISEKFPRAIVKIHIGDDPQMDKESANKANWIYIHPRNFR